jgi:hypothetical protein
VDSASYFSSMFLLRHCLLRGFWCTHSLAHSTAVVIPDIGGRQNDYVVLNCWSKWKELFIEWLEDDTEDVISDEEDLHEGDLAPFYKVLGKNWDQVEDLVPRNLDETSSNEEEDN